MYRVHRTEPKLKMHAIFNEHICHSKICGIRRDSWNSRKRRNSLENEILDVFGANFEQNVRTDVLENGSLRNKKLGKLKKPTH